MANGKGGTLGVTPYTTFANTDFVNFKHAFDKVFILEENSVAVRGGLSVLSENPDGSTPAGGSSFDLLLSWASDPTGKALSAELAKDFKVSTDTALSALSDMLSDRYTKSEVDNKLLTKASISHNHNNSYSPLSHTHQISAVTNLQTALDGKSDSSHVHTIANVTGLQGALDGKSSTGHNHDSQYLRIGATALDSFKLGGNPASDFFRNFGYDNSNPNDLGDFNNKNGVYLISDVAVNWTDPFRYGSVLNINNNVASWQIGVSSTAGAHPYFRSRWWSDRAGGSPWGNWEQLAFVSDVNKKVDTTTFNAFKTGAESSLNTLESKWFEHENTANNRFKAIEDYLTLLKGAFSINGVNVSVTGGLSANTYVSAGGVNTEGSGGAGGSVNILQSWENYRAETESYATTAKLLYDVKSVSEAGIADLRTDVTGLRASKADKHDHPYASTSHGHTWGEITGIPTEFIPKAHVHAIKDVTGLQTALDGKSESSHVHTIANITGLQGALDGKSSTGHNHDSAYLSKTAQAVDADKLDGKHASEFVDLASTQEIAGTKYFKHAKLNISDSIHTHMNVLISTNTAMEENEKGRVWRLLHTYKDNNETDNARGLNFYAYTNGSNGATHVARLTAHNDMPEFIVPYGRIKAKQIEINSGTSNHILLGDGTTLNRATLATASDLNSGLALKLDQSDWDSFQTAFNKAFTLNSDGSVTAKIGLSSDGYISALGSNTTIGGTGGENTYERLDSWMDYQEGQVLSAKLGKETHDQLQNLSDSVNTSLGDRYTKAESDGKYVAKEANKRLMTNAEGTKLAGLSNYTHPSSHSISEVSGLQDTINTINTALSDAVTKNTSQTISAPKYFDSHMLFVQSARTDYQQIISSTLDVIPNDAMDKKWALHHMYYSENSSSRGLSVYSYDATGKANRVARFKSHDENSFYVYGVIQANKYKLPEGTDNQILLGSGAILDRTTLATKSDVALKLDKSVYETHVADYNTHKSAWSSFQITYNSHVSDYSSFKSNTNTRLTTLEGHNHDTQYLGINAQAKDSAKFGGNLPSYFATQSDMVAHKNAWDAFKSAFDKAFVLNSDGSVKAKVGLSSDGYLSALGTSTETGGTGAGYVRLDDWNNYSEEQVLSAKLGKETRDAVQSLLTWKGTDFVDFHVSVNTALANRYTKTESDARYVAKETGKGLMTDAERTKLSGIATNANNYVHPAKHSISEITDLQTALDGKSVKGHNHDTAYSPLGHNHNDAYYTKSESDNLLSGKSDKNHNHNTAYSPLGHTHDDRYYTETEVDAKLGTKSDTTHNHDSVYSKLSHNHNTEYYTKSEVNTQLNGKSNSNHNHDTTYSKLNHTHEGFSTLKIGEATISYDTTNGLLKVDKGVYSEGAISSLGADNTSVGGSGGVNVLQDWVSDTDSVSGYALSAKLGYELRDTFANYQLKEYGKGLSANDFTTVLKSKLEGIDNNANNYTHPSTHPFSIITSRPTTLSGYGITDAMLKDGSNSTSSSSSTILRALTGSSDTFTDNTLIISSNASGEGGNPAYYKRGANKLWEYIQGKTNALYPTKTELDSHKTEMNGKLSDGSVTKLGKATVGSSGQPIFLNNGVPTISQPSEAFFQWGGQHISNGFSPIDASMVSALGANRFAFWKKEGIKIEYSNDGGETWEDYGASEGVVQILSILESSGASLRAGKRDNGAMTDNLGQLRVTIDFKNANIYTILNKLVMYMSTNGCSAVNCLIETQKASVYNSNPSAFTYLTEARLTGWSGYNVVNIPEVLTYYNDLAQIRVMRLTFSTSANGSNNNPFLIHNIAGFGGVGWNTPSNMAKTGHLYAISWSQQATFPNLVKATGFYTDGTTNILTANGSSIAQSTFATSGHNHDSVYSKLSHVHDDRYYTESEVDTKLGTKANSVHRHQQSEIEGLSDALGEKSNVGHTHDDRYFTEEEMSGVLDAHLTQIENLELTIMEQQEQIDALKAQLESVLSVLNISGNSIYIKGNITADGSISTSAPVPTTPTTSESSGSITANRP